MAYSITSWVILCLGVPLIAEASDADVAVVPFAVDVFVCVVALVAHFAVEFADVEFAEAVMLAVLEVFRAHAVAFSTSIPSEVGGSGMAILPLICRSIRNSVSFSIANTPAAKATNPLNSINTATSVSGKVTGLQHLHIRHFISLYPSTTDRVTLLSFKTRAT